MLGVWSREEVAWVDLEDGRVALPGIADGLERGSPSQRLEVLGEVVGGNEGQDVGAERFQVGVVEDLDGGVLHRGSSARLGRSSRDGRAWSGGAGCRVHCRSGRRCDRRTWPRAWG